MVSGDLCSILTLIDLCFTLLARVTAFRHMTIQVEDSTLDMGGLGWLAWKFIVPM